MFLSFTQEVLATEFSTLIYGQKYELLRIVESLKEQQRRNVEETSTPPRLESNVFQGFLNENGELLRTDSSSGSDAQLFQTVPCVSASFFTTKTGYSDQELYQTDPESVGPLDVVRILQESESGQKVLEFQQQKEYLTYSHQLIMMNILYQHVNEEENLIECSEKYKKIAIAKGIVQAFPKLADAGDCTWQSWYDYATVEFSKIQYNVL